MLCLSILLPTGVGEAAQPFATPLEIVSSICLIMFVVFHALVWCNRPSIFLRWDAIRYIWYLYSYLFRIGLLAICWSSILEVFVIVLFGIFIYVTLDALGFMNQMSLVDSLDDWLRRERFVFVGWSGLLLDCCSFNSIYLSGHCILLGSWSSSILLFRIGLSWIFIVRKCSIFISPYC